MVNYLFVAIGQCGNQLSYELLNMIYDHCIDNEEYFDYYQKVVRKKNSSSNLRGGKRESKGSSGFRPFYQKNSKNPSNYSQSQLYNSIFRDEDSFSADHQNHPNPGGKKMCTARIICLDTEPKVIDCCLEKTKSHFSKQSFYSWQYDPKNIAYRHSGAGNNWAMGYAMATGEFLEVSLNCIRNEIEKCDDIPVLIYIHSLAGGTGSGLGTHLVESSYETFSNCFHYHVLIAPHSFSEVIVQYYNALLCLSKVYSNTNGILIFDNENAQLLCKQMRLIEKPKLVDLNRTISNHLLALFLPKQKIEAINDPFLGSSHSTSLVDDLSYLCSNPYYRFFTLKLTPQTSVDSIDFTYDSWFSLINTIQRMQLSGCLSERNISAYVKSIGRASDLSYQTSSSSRTLKERADQLEVIREHEELLDEEEGFYSPISSSLNQRRKTSNSANSANSSIKSIASIITCHGEGSREAVQALQEGMNEEANNNLSETMTSTSRTSYSTARYSTTASHLTAKTTQTTGNFHQLRPHLYEEYLESHASYLYDGNSPLQCYASDFFLNQYHRSTTVLSNDQSLLPLLQRTTTRASEMFQVKAYVHQYLSNGLEEGDFVEAFQTLGSIIKYYSDL